MTFRGSDSSSRASGRQGAGGEISGLVSAEGSRFDPCAKADLACGARLPRRARRGTIKTSMNTPLDFACAALLRGGTVG